MGYARLLSPSMSQSNAANPWLAWTYLALAIAGGVLPWMANIAFMQDYGSTFDLRVFISLANANPAAQSLSRDLLVGATAVTIWMIVESKRLGMRHLWLVLLSSVTIAFAFAAPFFLFLRERRLAELAATGTTSQNS